MKKVIVIMAIAAFAACNSGTNTVQTVDSIKVDTTQVVDTVKNVVDTVKNVVDTVKNVVDTSK
jgi:hypothetical protein